MHYFKKQGYWYTQWVMPKFILFSTHETLVSAVDSFFVHNNLKSSKKFRPNFSTMFMFNYFECLTCEANERHIIEFSLYPHAAYDDDTSELIFRMSTGDFIETIENAIDNYVEKFDLVSSDLDEICQQEYV